ncbi:S-layer homology domain-containing protein, partial [Bacillus cereus]|nr:S-layer homology domain-containing protein [Bacillus cereus]
PFVDQNLIYAKEEVQRVYGYGIVKGNEFNQFVPKGPSQRAHAAAFINRMLSVIEA